jgi:cathepsin C exclusion domain-containing protein
MKVVSLIFMAAFVGLVAADLPIHCLRNQVIGEWTFHLTEKSFGPDIDCSIETSFTKELNVKLIDPNIVIGVQRWGWGKTAVAVSLGF